jgi:hypothetical protein
MTASCVVLPCTPPTLAAERQSTKLHANRQAHRRNANLHCSSANGTAKRRSEPNYSPEPNNSSLRKCLTAWKSRIACASIACGCGGAFGAAAPGLTAPNLRHDLSHPARSPAQALPSTGQTMPQTCRRETARASRISHPAPPSQRAGRLKPPSESILPAQEQPCPSFAWQSDGTPPAAPSPPRCSTPHPPPAFQPAHASCGSAHPPPSCS